MKRISALCILCFLLMSNFVIQAFPQEGKAVGHRMSQQGINKKDRNKEPQEKDQFSSKWTKGKDIQTLEGAEKCLERLLEQRNTLVADFFGINQTDYRYALIFDRLGYVRSRIVKTEREIKAIKRKITKFKEKAKKKAN